MEFKVTYNATPPSLQDTQKTDLQGDTEGNLKVVGTILNGTSEVSTTNPLPVSGQAFKSSASFTPAAASHLAGDVNGGAQEFTLVGPSGGHILINNATFMIAGSGLESTAWRLYLYDATPPSALADDAVFDVPAGDRGNFLGYIDLGTGADLGSTQWAESLGVSKQLKLSTTSLFGYLVNLTTLTPAAVAHTVVLSTVALS